MAILAIAPLETGTTVLAEGDADYRLFLRSADSQVEEVEWKPTQPRVVYKGAPATHEERYRVIPCVTRMPDGTVIAVGGIGRIASSEIYDPNTNSWVSGPDMQEPRYRFTSVTLDDGRIVVFGGTGKDGVLATTELFVP